MKTIDEKRQELQYISIADMVENKNIVDVNKDKLKTLDLLLELLRYMENRAECEYQNGKLATNQEYDFIDRIYLAIDKL